MIDLCDLDEVGFGMTLPTNYSWGLVGQRIEVSYEAPQGRRVNGVGAYFREGPEAGRFEYALRVQVPEKKGKRNRKSGQAVGEEPETGPVALPEGVKPEEVGKIDSTVLLEFIWGPVAGKPAGAGEDWCRERPLVIILDNYSVHKSHVIHDAQDALAAADVYLFSLPSYSPELSAIEPIWNAVKHHEIRKRSYAEVGDLKEAVATALARKAEALGLAHAKTAQLLRLAA